MKLLVRGLLVSILLAFAAPAPALAQYTAVLSWTAPTTRVDGSAITGSLTYNIYRGAVGNETLLIGGAVGTSYTDILPASVAGTQECWFVTAVETGVGLESAHTNEGCKTFIVVVTSPPAWPTVTPLTVK